MAQVGARGQDGDEMLCPPSVAGVIADRVMTVDRPAVLFAVTHADPHDVCLVLRLVGRAAAGTSHVGEQSDR